MRKALPETGSFRTRWWWEVPGGLFAVIFVRPILQPPHPTRLELQRFIVDT